MANPTTTHWIEIPDDLGSDLQKAAFRNAIYASELVSVAVSSFNFFPWLETSPAAFGAIRNSFRLTERTADVMLTLFCAMQLVEKRDHLFCVSANAGTILESLSPWFLDKASFEERPVHAVMEEVLRTGTPAGWAKGEKPWMQMMESETFARRFLKSMDSQALHLAPALATNLDLENRHRLLDIAGGSGIYACHIVQKHPHMKATVLEKVPVNAVTAEYIAESGNSESVDVTAGNIFSESLPGGYDVHLWSNALHDWDLPTVKKIIEKSYDALPHGGLIVIHDSHVNPEKTGPLAIANYSVFLMTSTEGKCYSAAEIEDCLASAGFRDTTARTSTLNHSIITALK